MAWEAEMVRVTAFLSNAAAAPFASWQVVTGRPPAQTVTRPGVSQEMGAHGAHQLLIGRGTDRADLALMMGPSPITPPPTLGPAEDVLTQVSALAQRWLAHGFGLGRLAVGAVLGQRAGSPEEAMRLLQPHLTMINLAQVMPDDFLLQLNDRRESASVRGLQLNCLTKWQVQAHFLLSVSPEGSRQSEPFFSAGLELDVNSVPGPAIEGGRVPALLDELVEIARRLAQRGRGE